MILTVICDVLGEENNGTTVAAMNLIRSMRRKGHTVRVVCPDENRRGQEGFYVVPTLSLGPLNGYLAKNGVLLAKPDRKVLLSALEGADAVHIITPFLMSMSAVRLVHKLGLPVTAGFHCQAENFTNHIFLMNSHGVNRLVYRVFDKNLYRFVDCIHYPTDFISGVFEEEIGHPTTHRVISNGVNSAFMPMDVEKPEEYR
ncbi:MAG: glycosyltransferase, partial [Clostridia bacterium]|nr:glycosyltransferase [Clostridia bacterium]